MYLFYHAEVSFIRPSGVCVCSAHVYRHVCSPAGFFLSLGCFVHAAPTAALWYILANYPPPTQPHFPADAQCQLYFSFFIYSIRVAPAHLNPLLVICFFFSSLPPCPRPPTPSSSSSLSHSVVGRSPWIIHHCEMKKLMDIEYPLWSGGQPCGVSFFSLLSSFLLLSSALKNSYRKKRHPSDLVARLFQRLTNWLFYLLHIFGFPAALGPNWLKRLGRKQETGENRSSYLCFRPAQEVRLTVVGCGHVIDCLSGLAVVVARHVPVVLWLETQGRLPGRLPAGKHQLTQRRRRRISPVSIAVFHWCETQVELRLSFCFARFARITFANVCSCLFAVKGGCFIFLFMWNSVSVTLKTSEKKNTHNFFWHWRNFPGSSISITIVLRRYLDFMQLQG